MPVRIAEDEGKLLISSPNAEDDTSFAKSDDVASVKRSAPEVRRLAALLAVPLLWGTFTPSMKLLLAVREPPPALIINLLSHVVGAATLLALWWVRGCTTRDGCDAILDPSRRRRAAWASGELGVYLFFGQLTQMLGLQGTSATVNAILVQASVVIVPLLDSGLPGSSRVLEIATRLLPSLLALGGIALLTVAPEEVDASAADRDAAAYGIGLSLASAAFYALHTLRLSEYGDVDPTAQAAGQVVANALLDLLALPLGFGQPAHLWLSQAGPPAVRRLGAAALWNGLMVVGATTWAMSYAQQAVAASTAALVYAMEPVCAALIAALILHESLVPLQIAGGVLVVFANAVASGVWRG